ncbi:MAG: hypothetical protein ACFFAN_05465 [Promethearchaeota archaeon]
MENNNFERLLLEKIYKIDEARLYKYYKRIKNQSNSLDPPQIVAKFLNNLSIGNSINEVFCVLNYYNSKIRKSLIDFAFEWIRAQKIRLEYKKHLMNTQFPTNELAVDDCIFLFFLNYDKYIRTILNTDIKEFEISALYESFFLNSFESKALKIENIIEKHKNKVPTIFREAERINTHIITLRSGLSEIIEKDYQEILYSKKEKKN